MPQMKLIVKGYNVKKVRVYIRIILFFFLPTSSELSVYPIVCMSFEMIEGCGRSGAAQFSFAESLRREKKCI